MDYLLKSSSLFLLMYLGYALFLKKETFFTHNRWFLLVGIITATLLPLIEIPIYVSVEATAEAEFPLQFQYIPTEIIAQEQPFDWLQLATYIYLAGVTVFFIQFLLQFGSLAVLLLKNSKNKEGIYTYVIVKSKISPFSFFKWIVYNPHLFSEEELQLILNHEKVHVRQWHSLDIILSRLACVAFWFNPICWMYHKSIQQNLEYIADTETQNTSASEKDYQALLLKTTVANTNINLTSNFYNSLIKKRIIMLQKSKSNPSNRWKSALVLPFFILFLMSVNTKEIFVEVEKPILAKEAVLNSTEEIDKFVEAFFSNTVSDAKLETIKKQLEAEGVTLKVKTVKRNKKGLVTSINLTFSSDNKKVSYAVKDNDGIAPFMFTMEDGKMKVEAVEIIEVVETPEIEETKNTFIIKSTDTQIEADTIIVQEVQPKGKYSASYTFVSSDSVFINKPVIKANGNVKVKSNTFTIKTDSVNYNNSFKIRSSNGTEPIFILNGKKIDRKKFKSVNPNSIEKVDVIKGEKAIKIYGEAGKDGVIKIKTIKTSPKTNTLPSSSIEEAKIFLQSKDKPLLFVNDKLVTDYDAATFDFSVITEVSVLNADQATKMWGERGKNGVVFFFTADREMSVVLSKPLGRVTINNSENKKESPWAFTTGVSSVRTLPNSTKEEAEEFIKSADKPLIIINNEVLGNISTSGLDYNLIKEVSILKGDEAIELYGEKANNGAVIIFTSEEVERSLKERKKYAKKYKTRVSAIGFLDEAKPEEAMALYFISKITSDSMINKHVNKLKSAGIIAKISKLKRNSKNEITKIKIKLSDENGNNSEAVFSNNDGISTIKIGKQGSTLVVSSEKF